MLAFANHMYCRLNLNIEVETQKLQEVKVMYVCVHAN